MTSRMKTYSVLYAEDVPHYATGEIEARTDKAAIRKARKMKTEAFCSYDPDWDASVCKRIVFIEAPDGNNIAEDIALDRFHLRNGGEQDRRLCAAAPELLRALRQIAATPLWGELIPPGGLRDDYAATAQYDVAEDSFEPCCDTESTQLRDAVETARLALLTLDGRGS
jgi:hypothetical protein